MKAEKIWMDGKMVDWDEAKVHVCTHALHYGSGVFEGIRAYETESGTAVFRLKEHIERLFNSAKIFKMDIPYTKEDIREAIKNTIKANKLKSGYIRPLIYRGFEQLGLNPFTCPVNCSIAVWEWGAYLGEEALANGIKTKISSYARSYINSTSQKAKICGNYVNSIFAKMEAIEAGADEAILLDTRGFVTEGSGENIFWIKNGIIYTTPTATVLEGITRDSIIKIAEDMNYQFQEKYICRDELYISDEVFFTGTAAEVTPIREIDNYQIGEGKRGPITENIQKKFFAIAKGEEEKYLSWLDFV
ncbi:branched chain amino acid aminotransferase [Candidatus Atribacteria bacterium RBG_19FT_COMBO_35_14]|uniref:Branched-chain-amino-acid aminotransferase n=1 Tax=Candidatus Sediminicultor quintus TaxID=1797291 RepID=A0A1F5ABU7_9BACT|nr:MAG: branched chain amino acid aminotransferase [Candidatus Atribacteria bacterium RBG_19FT_COMBO_35_14]